MCGWHDAVAPATNMPLLEAALLLLTPPIQSARLEGARETITHHKYQGKRYGSWVHQYFREYHEGSTDCGPQHRCEGVDHDPLAR